MNPEKTSEDDNSNENLVGLRGFIDDCFTFEEAFELLNVEGSKNGVSFKRGNTHYHENSKPLRDKRIICTKSSRNKPKSLKEMKGNKESLDQVPEFKETKDCPVYYKFTFKKKMVK